MSPESFCVMVIGSLADIRTALWSMVAVGGALSASIVLHAFLTRERNRR